MGDYPSSLLTSGQREYLKGEKEASNESQMKKRIRERVYAGFREDGGILLDELSTEERRRMFRHWEDREDERHREGVTLREDGEVLNTFEKSTLEINLGSLLGFIYFGVEETNLSDFEELLESGIQRAAQQYGYNVSSLNFEVEFEEALTPADTFEYMKNEEVSLEELKEHIPMTHVNTIAQSDSFDLEELPERFREFIVQANTSFQEMRERVESGEFLERMKKIEELQD